MHDICVFSLQDHFSLLEIRIAEEGVIETFQVIETPRLEHKNYK